jgi:hypothetical protein
MYALAVMMSRSEDAVQTYYQSLPEHEIRDGIPCGGSWKSSCQSCKEVGRGDRTDVGNTCPSPTSQLQIFNLSAVVGK